MIMKGAQILCECLVREGVEVIFGFPGGAIIDVYDTLPQYPQLRHILVRHEQGAAHAADGYARVTGKVGVCFATSGPGATNLVTGIANAYMDSVPIVAVTGQVATPMVGKDGFQEADITGITLPITKQNYLVMRVEDLAATVKEAFYLARTGRPGPVLLDIPKDVLQAEANFVYPEHVSLQGYRPTLQGHPLQIRRAAQLIASCKRPVIVAGHGVLIAGASAELRELAEKAQIPVVTTLLGKGCFPESHPLAYGMLGMHGTAYANMAVNGSDLVIAIGMRFDDRATGRFSGFAPNAQVVHIDIDPAEIGKNVRVNVPIVGDARTVLLALNREVSAKTHDEWINQIDKWRLEHPLSFDQETNDLLPQFVVRKIWETTGGDAIIVTGVGQNQMWAAQHYRFDRPNTIVTSGGLGTMGFELPAAVGAKVGCPDKTVWAICGDGGFQMTVQELAVMVQEKLAVKMAILNNGFLGMVRQWQELFYGRRYVATPLLNPDFCKIAEAYGIKGIRVTEKDMVEPALREAMADVGPVLIDFRVRPEENVFPMVPAGASLADTMDGLPQEREVVQQ